MASLSRRCLLLSFLALGVFGKVTGQDIFKILEDKPLEMYELYGNPALEAAKGFPKLLLSEEQLEWRDLLGILYLPLPDEYIVNNTDCVEDVMRILKVWEKPRLMAYIMGTLKQYWPATLPDSWGLPGDGILNGDSMPWGFQEECTAVNADVRIGRPWNFAADFQGKYCLVHIEKGASIFELSPRDLQEKVTLDILSSPDYYYYGTCMPSSCNAVDLKDSLNVILNKTNWKLADVKCQTKDREYIEESGGDTAFEVVVGIIWCVIVGASLLEFLIDLAEKPELKKGPLKYVLVLSFYRNTSSIFRVVNKTNPDVIDCLHGMRALSMIWVTWCHSYSLFTKVTENLKGLQVITQSAAAQIILNGSFSADTFFFMSGLLAAYSVLREQSLTGKVNWIMYYVHRILRLLPTTALTCFLMATVAKYSLAGPYGPYVNEENLQPCRDYWYMDVLFASNFATNGNRCLPQSWYLAVDAQLYLILPLILVPLILKRKVGLVVLSGFTLASFVIPCSIYAAYNLSPNLPFAVPKATPEDTTFNQDEMPWNRASPYFVGVWGGWLLSLYREKNMKIPHCAPVVLGWCVSITLALLVLLGLAPYNTTVNPEELPSSISILYGGFSRGAWGLSLLWLVVACQKGFAGPINTFLSHPVWLPMSRLAFCMFLITVPVQILSTGGTFVPMYMNHLSKFVETCGYLFVSGLLAIGLAITSELPILALEKVIFPRKGRNVQEEPIKES